VVRVRYKPTIHVTFEVFRAVKMMMMMMMIMMRVLALQVQATYAKLVVVYLTKLFQKQRIDKSRMKG
jgi:hypothetical protein